MPPRFVELDSYFIIEYLPTCPMAMLGAASLNTTKNGFWYSSQNPFLLE